MDHHSYTIHLSETSRMQSTPNQPTENASGLCKKKKNTTLTIILDLPFWSSGPLALDTHTSPTETKRSTVFHEAPDP